MTRRRVLAGGAAALLGASRRAVAALDDMTRRVWDSRARRDLSWDELLRRLAFADVVFVGEEHDDPETHTVEADLLAGLHARVGARLTLAMEMFERDGQSALNDYLAGKIGEDALAKSVTLWPNYATDYRPTVVWARTHRVPVLASNVPRRVARSVSQAGLEALDALPSADRKLAAAYVTAPADAYWERFRKIIGVGHGDANDKNSMDAATARRFYLAQCLKDDTMAESVVRALDAGRVVLHVNGSFHSDAGLGTAARVLWRRPLGTRVAVVKIVPVRGDLARAETGTFAGEADFLILVRDRRPEAAASPPPSSQKRKG